MRLALLALLPLLLLGGGTAASLGCSDCRVDGQAVLDYTEGIIDDSGTIYESSRVDEQMLHFPQGRTYALHHGLGSRPVTVDIFLSFVEQLTEDGDRFDKTRPNNLAPSAGNQAVIEVWNDEIIQIRNDTCADFYVRVVAIASEGDNGGMAGASAN